VSLSKQLELQRMLRDSALGLCGIPSLPFSSVIHLPTCFLSLFSLTYFSGPQFTPYSWTGLLFKHLKTSLFHCHSAIAQVTATAVEVLRSHESLMFDAKPWKSREVCFSSRRLGATVFENRAGNIQEWQTSLLH
jgi:hypothetical protein